MINDLNALLFLGLGVLLGFAIMSNSVRDGIIMKTGLGLMALGCIGGFGVFVDKPQDYAKAIAAVHSAILLGLLVCIVAYAIRTRSGSNRRLSDWVNHDPR